MSPCFRCTDWWLLFLLINIYNANTKKEQISVIDELTTILSNFENIDNHNVIFAEDFNIFFEASSGANIFAEDFNIFLGASSDAKGGTPTLKSPSSRTDKTKQNVRFMWYMENKKL